MWTNEFLMETKTPSERIWQLWADVENWKQWDDSVEHSTLDGKFENGTWGILKAIHAPKSTFRLENVVVNKSFTCRSTLPLCTMDFIHELIKENDGLKVKHCIRIYGPLTFLFKRIIGKNAAKGLPAAVKKLVDMAQH